MDSPQGKPRRFAYATQNEKTITVYDDASYQHLKEVILTFCPDDWAELSEELPVAETPLSPPPLPVEEPPKISATPVLTPPPIVPPPLPPSIPPKEVPTLDPAERRGERRFDLEFRVILICGNRTFRTSSTNISKGGMQVKQRIPESMLKQVCRVYIGSSDLKENIEFHCVVIEDPRNPKRVRFSNPDPISTERLTKWIAQHPHFSQKKNIA